MKRNLIIGLVVAVGVALALSVAVAQTTKSGEVKDAFVIKAEVKGYTLKRDGVGFTHKKHSVDYKIGCAECHHTYKDGKNVWKEGDKVERCASCHDPNKKQDKADKLMNAMHKNCQECHKELEKGGKKTGPTRKCNDCHTGKIPS